MIQSYIYLPSFVNVLCAATVIWSGFVRFGEYIYLVYIATVYAYGYIISHLFVYFVYLHTFLCICAYIYSERASYKNLTYLTYPSKNNNEWCQSNISYTTHKHFHDQYRITCRISESYTLTEKAPQKNSLYSTLKC